MSTDNSDNKTAPRSSTPFSLAGICQAVNGLFSSRSATIEIKASPDNKAPEKTVLPKNRFLEAAARVFESKHYAASASSTAPYGYFRSRHIIGDCTRFHGGIFISHLPGEALVVDEVHGTLPRIYDLLVKKIAQCSTSPQRAEYEIFNEVIALVNEVIRIDHDQSARLKQEQNLVHDEKISLDVYVMQGFGLPAHQVLLAGYLLEKLSDEKKIRGIVSLDSALSSEHPTEETLLYTSSSGCVLRFSPAEKYISNMLH